MKYRIHKHLSLDALSNHPEVYLHVISMLTNHQNYSDIQIYVKKVLHKLILKSVISNLKNKLILSKNTGISLKSLLDNRRKSKNLMKQHQVTPNDCLNDLLTYSDNAIKNQTITNKERTALISALKLKLRYPNELKDSVFDKHVLRTVLEHDHYVIESLTLTIESYCTSEQTIRAATHKFSKYYHQKNPFEDKSALNLAKKYCKRNDIDWNTRI